MKSLLRIIAIVIFLCLFGLEDNSLKKIEYDPQDIEPLRARTIAVDFGGQSQWVTLVKPAGVFAGILADPLNAMTGDTWYSVNGELYTKTLYGWKPRNSNQNIQIEDKSELPEVGEIKIEDLPVENPPANIEQGSSNYQVQYRIVRRPRLFRFRAPVRNFFRFLFMR